MYKIIKFKFTFNKQFKVIRQDDSMHCIEVHKTLNRMISALYFFGLWQSDNVSHCRSWCVRTWYLGVYGYVVIALAGGALTTDNENEMVFLAVLSIVAFVLEIRLYFFLLKKDVILGFIRNMGVHSIKDDEEFYQVNDKIKAFIKFVSSFEIMLVVAVSTMAIIALPFFTSEKRLPLHYYFPFNWQENIILYITAYTFVTYGLMLTSLCTLFNVIIWYLMMSCAIKYQILGNELKNIGCGAEENDATVGEQDLFLLELIVLIKKHKQLGE